MSLIFNKFHSRGRVTPPTGFGFEGGGTIPNPTSWTTWLQNQAAPKFKPNHRLPLCGIYFYGNAQEEGISIDMAERWGFVLNTGYDKYTEYSIADAQSASPSTQWGRLIKKAIQNPTKYPIGGAVIQAYPPSSTVPEGYVTNRTTGEITRRWSPAAPVAAQQAAQNYRMADIRRLRDLGVRFGLIYDGGENGFDIIGDNPELGWGIDSQVVADKGSRTWSHYISLRKGEDMKRIYDEVVSIAPDIPYVYYPCEARAYANIPASELYGWEYEYTRIGTKYPSSSSYYREFNISLGDPSQRAGGSYYDLLTNITSAISEQISNYGQQLSYNWVCGGWFLDVIGSSPPTQSRKSRVPERFAPINLYKGFLKCYYTLGNIGAVAGYFSADCIPGMSAYPPYDPAGEIPPWLEQQMALGEIHARFSWLDEYLLDGDLLPGVLQHPIKTGFKSFEMDGKKQFGNFLIKVIGTRVFARKIRNANRWLVTVWSYDRVARDVIVDDIPGVPRLTLRSREEGSIYTIEQSGSNFIVDQKDL